MWSKKTGGLSCQSCEQLGLIPLTSSKRAESLFYVRQKNDQTRSKENHKQTIPPLPFCACVVANCEESIEEERRNYVAYFSALFSPSIWSHKCEARENLEAQHKRRPMTRRRESFERSSRKFSLTNKQDWVGKKVSLTRSSVNFVEWKRSFVS